MNAIIQHNFNTGWGDCLFAMTDYIALAKDLKRNGFNVKLHINLFFNFYMKQNKIFNYIDKKNFSVFDGISISNEPIKHGNELICVWTLNNVNEASHYFDLFIDADNSSYFDGNNIKFSHSNIYKIYENQELAGKPILLEKKIIKEYKKFLLENNLKEYQAIHFRGNHGNTTESSFSGKKEKIKELLMENKQFFISSNNYAFKNFVRSLNTGNVYFTNHHLENNLGSYHDNNLKLNDDDLDQRTKDTLLDMLILGGAKKVYFAADGISWISNFLYFSANNKNKIELY